MQKFFAVWRNSFLWFDTIYLIVHQQVAAWTQLLKRYIIQHCIKHSVYTRENRLQWKPLFLHIFCSRVLTIFWFCIWIFHKLNFQKKYMELMIFYWRIRCPENCPRGKLPSPVRSGFGLRLALELGLGGNFPQRQFS